jgi:hypothetical protein
MNPRFVVLLDRYDKKEKQGEPYTAFALSRLKSYPVDLSWGD